MIKVNTYQFQNRNQRGIKMKNKLLLIGVAGGIGVIIGAAMAFKKIMDEDMLCDDDDDGDCDDFDLCDCHECCACGCDTKTEKDNESSDSGCDGADSPDGGSADNTADAGETGEDAKAGTDAEK